MAREKKTFEALNVGDYFVADSIALSGSACMAKVRNGQAILIGQIENPVMFNDGTYHIRPVNLYRKTGDNV